MKQSTGRFVHSERRNRLGRSFEGKRGAGIDPRPGDGAPGLVRVQRGIDTRARHIEFVVAVVRRVVTMPMSGIVLVRLRFVVAVSVPASVRRAFIAEMRRQGDRIVRARDDACTCQPPMEQRHDQHQHPRK